MNPQNLFVVVLMLVWLTAAQEVKPFDAPTPQRKEDLAILDAAATGKLQELRQAIFAGANVEARDGNEGNTPLIWAAFYNHLEAVNLLLKHKANVNALSLDSHKTALLLASYNGHAKMVEFLLNKGADINHANSRGDTSVAIAAYMNKSEVVQVLLEHRACLRMRTKSQHYQALHLAAYKGHEVIVGLLLEQYRLLAAEDLESQDKVRDDINETATSIDPKKRIRSPKSQWLDIDAADKQGNSPLMLAAMQGHTQTVGILLDAGAELQLQDQLGNTPLMLAVNKGHLETVQWILKWVQLQHTESGDDSSDALLWQLQTTNEEEQTPLLRACIKGFSPMVQVLLMEGASLTHTGKDGLACEDVAKSKGWKEILRIISEYKSSHPLLPLEREL